MKIEKIISVLNNSTRRKIIQLLAEKDMTAPEIFIKLGVDSPKYRQSINKALEKLKESNLIEKYYSDEKKNLNYHLKIKRIIIDIENMKLLTK